MQARVDRGGGPGAGRHAQHRRRQGRVDGQVPLREQRRGHVQCVAAYIAHRAGRRREQERAEQIDSTHGRRRPRAQWSASTTSAAGDSGRRPRGDGDQVRAVELVKAVVDPCTAYPGVVETRAPSRTRPQKSSGQAGLHVQGRDRTPPVGQHPEPKAATSGPTSATTSCSMRRCWQTLPEQRHPCQAARTTGGLTTLVRTSATNLDLTSHDTRAAAEHFAARLQWAIDASDLHAALETGEPGFMLVDSRGDAWPRRRRIPGAIHLPLAEMREQAADVLDPDVPVVTAAC